MAERDVRARKAVTAIIGDCPRRMGATMAGLIAVNNWLSKYIAAGQWAGRCPDQVLFITRTSYINIALAALLSVFRFPCLLTFLPPNLRSTLGYLPLKIQPLNKPLGLYEDYVDLLQGSVSSTRDRFCRQASANCRRPNNSYRVLINAAL